SQWSEVASKSTICLFSQAEDGIRSRNLTVVQTCALPIFFFTQPNTPFSLFATFEKRGRELGGKGVFGWVKKMPWKDVRFLAPFKIGRASCRERAWVWVSGMASP